MSREPFPTAMSMSLAARSSVDAWSLLALRSRGQGRFEGKISVGTQLVVANSPLLRNLCPCAHPRLRPAYRAAAGPSPAEHGAFDGSLLLLPPSPFDGPTRRPPLATTYLDFPRCIGRGHLTGSCPFVRSSSECNIDREWAEGVARVKYRTRLVRVGNNTMVTQWLKSSATRDVPAHNRRCIT